MNGLGADSWIAAIRLAISRSKEASRSKKEISEMQRLSSAYKKMKTVLFRPKCTCQWHRERKRLGLVRLESSDFGQKKHFASLRHIEIHYEKNVLEPVGCLKSGFEQHHIIHLPGTVHGIVS